MKKILTLLLLAFNVILNAQTDPGFAIDKRAGKFFKTYEDYLKDKPVDGVSLSSMSEYGWTLEVTENGKTEKIKDSKTPYPWFCNQQGMLMRVYDEKIYYVLIEGPLCHYAKCREAWAGHTVYTKTNTLHTELAFLPSGNEPFKEYYSETINGEIKLFKDKLFDELLEKYGLKDQFEADKLVREKKDSVLDYKNKEWNKRVKYKKLINEKMK